MRMAFVLRTRRGVSSVLVRVSVLLLCVRKMELFRGLLKKAVAPPENGTTHTSTVSLLSHTQPEPAQPTLMQRIARPRETKTDALRERYRQELDRLAAKRQSAQNHYHYTRARVMAMLKDPRGRTDQVARKKLAGELRVKQRAYTVAMNNYEQLFRMNEMFEQDIETDEFMRTGQELAVAHRDLQRHSVVDFERLRTDIEETSEQTADNTERYREMTQILEEGYERVGGAMDGALGAYDMDDDSVLRELEEELGIPASEPVPQRFVPPVPAPQSYYAQPSYAPPPPPPVTVVLSRPEESQQDVREQSSPPVPLADPNQQEFE